MRAIGWDERIAWAIAAWCGYALIKRGAYLTGGYIVIVLAVAIALRVRAGEGV